METDPIYGVLVWSFIIWNATWTLSCGVGQAIKIFENRRKDV